MKVSTEKKIYKEIQKRLFSIIPEKWDSIFLYASVIDIANNHITGEMYFYYFPKSLITIKKKPINCYEVPSAFNIDETEYANLISELYNLIKTLRQVYIKKYNKRWSNLTISIQNSKFKIEYDYENLNKSMFDSYERHIIWRYIYLKTDIKLFSKKEKNVIETYLDIMENKEESKKDTYIENIYDKPVKNIVDYEKMLSVEEVLARSNKEENVKKEKNRIFGKNRKAQDVLEFGENDGNINNQILNWKK